MTKIVVTTEAQGTVVNLLYDGESTPIQQTTGGNKKATFEYVDDNATYSVSLASGGGGTDKIITTEHIIT